jgi:hypothetical protein
MENILLTLLGMLGLVLLVASVIIASYIPRRWIWFSIICAFLAGLLPGVYVYGFWSGVAIGAVFVVIFIPGAILTRYYREKASKRLKSSG